MFPSLSNVFKWLWNTLTNLVSYVFCHVIDFLLAIPLAVFQYVIGLLPDVAVPAWLSGAGAASTNLQFLAFYFPVG